MSVTGVFTRPVHNGGMDAINTAYSGMMAASRDLNAVATSVANGVADPVRAAVDEASADTSYEANAAVMMTAQAMAGALLDIRV